MEPDVKVTITVRAGSLRTALAALDTMAQLSEKPENRQVCLNAYSDLNEARHEAVRFHKSEPMG